MEMVGTDMGEWEDPNWKGWVQMWENGKIQSRRGMSRCSRMGRSKVERVGTFMGEWEIQSGKGMYICGRMGDPKWKG